ncbi:hypothetical protein ES754_10370 [Psychrobacter frigidicola]|uniref:Winged helix-turn-helix domain-containing protein n=1 Tax=Psychrobacter frigidicola TaxID=45611 RepID=A0A5C6ZZX4_9GAMM|nr:helix-turn-helix domain-containing protein [Psychrobacter frigidicola]TXD96533.1 hypothetical protein ES754_10370 [Psychrobacter frigidicola]
MNTTQPKQNYKQIIHNHMLGGKTISTMEAFTQYGITCFLQRISELRATGVIIQDETVKQNGKRFKRYWIDKQANDLSDEVTL